MYVDNQNVSNISSVEWYILMDIYAVITITLLPVYLLNRMIRAALQAK